jgi:hypothetical protein
MRGQRYLYSLIQREEEEEEEEVAVVGERSTS